MRRAVALAAVVVVAVAGCGAGPAPPRSAAERFLDRYVDADGRVVRRDQGGDTVSEGQAYALLAAVSIGDRDRFERVWRWTRRELRRPDGLLAWRWAHGRVADRQPAADADLDAARALSLGARRFARPDLERAAARMARSVLREERRGDRLVAGPWARAGAVVNPSYTSPRAAAALARTGEPAAWHALARRGIADTRALLAGGRLPPDWAKAGARVTPTGPPAGGAAPQYGYDAARLPVRLAEACEPGARDVAARLWARLRGASASIPRRLDGASTGPGRHPVALVGAAGAAAAAGDTRARDRLLDDAAALDRAAPSYYGAAWVALGRAMLQTDTLVGCR